MESVEVKFDLERTKSIYKNYFKYEERKLMKKIPIWPISGLGLVLVACGLIFYQSFLFYFGIIILALMFLIVRYYKSQFDSAYQNYIKKIESNSAGANADFTFGFDERGISYKSENANLDFTWSMIGHFVVNNDEVYIYTSENKLQDIISTAILGEENFDSFMSLLKAKIAVPEAVV